MWLAFVRRRCAVLVLRIDVMSNVVFADHIWVMRRISCLNVVFISEVLDNGMRRRLSHVHAHNACAEEIADPNVPRLCLPSSAPQPAPPQKAAIGISSTAGAKSIRTKKSARPIEKVRWL
ncbi:hypothetical protein FB567DRAFT_302113 [Paraphoma chrysanthemicola]|uniref:Secreted protein n=1 Tax=Paraphoma chrysanthemicola TaxID=798071 RepID=A0A8K0R8N2_9PLEO|nr:hypothetical protein FB567DRAFT_302113 [Paraphoma chrysanthemicola]